MPDRSLDPYAVLGVSRDVPDTELRRVYRGLVQRHHPDHNGGSPAAAARFALIQDAYAAIARERRVDGGPAVPTAGPGAAAGDPAVEARIARLERELAAQREAERRRAAEQASRARPSPGRSTPEELGYYTTEDSVTQILDDAAEQLAQRLRPGEAKKQFARRLADLFGGDA